MVVGVSLYEDQRSLNPVMVKIEPRSPNAPVVPLDWNKKPLRQIHTYKTLGEGAFGKVTISIDLATGSLYAVKECKKKTDKRDFKVEVEKLAALRHPNIFELEHHQGWIEGMTVQIFLPLYNGGLTKLLPRHDCSGKFRSDQPAWLGTFIDQVLSGLSFMHSKGIVHRGLKTDNIPFKEATSRSRYNFVISDFGLAASASSMQDVGGTLVYMAPETTRNGRMTSASDVYRFGLVLLEATGRYCPEEGDPRRFDVARWRKKLEINARGNQTKKECQGFKDKASHGADFFQGHEARHGRVKSLSTFQMLRRPVQDVLESDPARRNSAAVARTELLKAYGSTAPAGAPVKKAVR